MANMKRVNKLSEHLLMIEGAKTYPQALAALSEFRNLFVYACREVFEADLTSLSNALGVRISREEILNRLRPDSPDGADAVNAEVGIRVDRRREGWRLYYSLAWWKTSKPELWVQLIVRFTGRDRAAAFCTPLKKAQLKTLYHVGVEGSSVYVSYQMKPEQMSELPRILHGLNQESVRIWRSVGGLKKAGIKTKATNAKSLKL
jgi:hypothetical protein